MGVVWPQGTNLDVLPSTPLISQLPESQVKHRETALGEL